MQKHFNLENLKSIIDPSHKAEQQLEKKKNKVIQKNKKQISEIQSVIDRAINAAQLHADSLKRITALLAVLAKLTKNPTTKAEKKKLTKINSAYVKIKSDFDKRIEKNKIIMGDLKKWLTLQPKNINLVNVKDKLDSEQGLLLAGMNRIASQFALRDINVKADLMLEKVASSVDASENASLQYQGQGAQDTEFNRHQLFTLHRDGRVTGNYYSTLFRLPSTARVVGAEAIETEENLHVYHMRLLIK